MVEVAGTALGFLRENLNLLAAWSLPVDLERGCWTAVGLGLQVCLSCPSHGSCQLRQPVQSKQLPLRASAQILFYKQACYRPLVCISEWNKDFQSCTSAEFKRTMVASQHPRNMCKSSVMPSSGESHQQWPNRDSPCGPHTGLGSRSVDPNTAPFHIKCL